MLGKVTHQVRGGAEAMEAEYIDADTPTQAIEDARAAIPSDHQLLFVQRTEPYDLAQPRSP